MADIVEGAKKYQQYLEIKEIKNFKQEELEDEHRSVIFRSSVAVQGQYIPLGVIFDDTIYVIVRANLAPKALNDENAYAVSSYLLRLNHGNKLFKYYLAPDTSIILDACIPMLPQNFSAELIQTIVGVVVKEVEKRHDELMQLIWQN